METGLPQLKGKLQAMAVLAEDMVDRSVKALLEGDVAVADAFIHRLEFAINAASLGGVETLVTRPVQTSHSLMSPLEREKAGISDTLIRYSVGIESANDLIADLKQALV